MNSNELNSKLEIIGIRVSGVSFAVGDFVDIEETIYQAALTSPNDSRMLSLLCSWVKVHGDKVIIEKLMKKQRRKFAPWLVAVAVFAEGIGLHQWKRLIAKIDHKLFLINEDLAKSQIERKGAFKGMVERNILIASNEIRIRQNDIFSREELARKNRQYRNRFLYGACIRSDIITLIEEGTPNPYQIAKKIGCSQGPAYRIFKEYELLRSIGAA